MRPKHKAQGHARKETAVLFSRRKRQQALAKLDAEGSTFWSADFPEEVRTRVFLSDRACVDVPRVLGARR